jgi:hypothetical protein
MLNIYKTALDLVPGNGANALALQAAGLTQFSESSTFSHEPTEPAAHIAMHRAVAEHMRMGTPVPEDIADAVVEASNFDLSRQFRAQAMNGILAESRVTAAHVRPESIEAALEYLRAELARIVRKTLDLAPHVVGIRTAADAIKTGPSAVNAWSNLNTLDAELREIRLAQADLIQRVHDSAHEPFAGDQFEAVAHFADSLDVLPRWAGDRLAASRRGAAEDGTGGNSVRVEAYRAWLTDTTPSPAFTEEAEAPALLVLLIQTTTPWIPDYHTWKASSRAALGATKALAGGNITALEANRAQYYALSDITRTFDQVPTPDRHEDLTSATADLHR